MTPSTYTPRSPSLPCDVGGCHSSTRPPHRAGGSKAKLARARIGDIDHADIIALHRLADLVPAYPHFLQLRGIADGAHLLFDVVARDRLAVQRALALAIGGLRSEEHTSELQSLMRISYAVFCLKKKNNIPLLIT